MTAAGLAIAAAGLAALLAGRLHVLLHLFQLEHYEAARLRVWVARRGERLELAELGGVLVAGAALTAACAAGSSVAALVVGAAAGAAGIARGRAVLERPQVKPLVFTARARRLFGLSLGLPLAILLGFGIAGIAGLDATVVAVAGTVTGLAAHVAAPELLALADRLLRPVQALDNRRLVRRAQRRL